MPLVKLTKSRDGTSGTAFFTFENPDIFEGSSGDITGMYLQDEEGEMQTVRFRVSARCFVFISRIRFSDKTRFFKKSERERERSYDSGQL